MAWRLSRLAWSCIACLLNPVVLMNYGHIGALLLAFIYRWLLEEERPLHLPEDAAPCLGRCSCSHRAEAQALARHRRFQSGVVPPFRDENHKKEALETLSKEAPSLPQSLSAWSNIPHACMEEAKDMNWNGEEFVIELSRIICRP